MSLKTIKKNGKILLLIILIFVFCFININSNIKKKDKNKIIADIFHKEDWARIYPDEYVIYNNVWGKEHASYYTQSVYQEDKDKLSPFGWIWDWPDTGNGYVKAYPEIYFGHSPWTDASTTDKIPIAVKDIKNITVTYDIESKAAGVYNLALEFWMTSEKKAAESNITTEVMIWLDYKDWPWFPPLIKRVKIDGEEYDLYKGNVSHAGWNYIVFKKIKSEYNGDTKIHEFTEYLVKNNYINKNDYVSCIDFGNEIIHGTGHTKFIDFSISVE